MTGINLVDTPWITVLTVDGRIEHHGIRTLLHDAARIRTLSTGGADTDLAVLRLLGAILLRAHKNDPDIIDTWKTQWARNILDLEPVDRYLDTWHDRFSLYDAARPFLQSPGLACRILPVTDMFQQPDLYASHRRATLPAADSAIRLLALQCFDAGGIKPADPHDNRATRGKLMPPPRLAGAAPLGCMTLAWPEYDTLTRTLLANTPPTTTDGTPTTSPEDRPAWEKDPLTTERLGDRPTGIVDQLTLQSRRILLHHDDQEETTGFSCTYGRIIGRDNLTAVEPHCAWNRDGDKPAVVNTMRAGLPAWARLPELLWDTNRVPLALAWAGTLDPQREFTLHWMGASYRQMSAITAIEHHAMRITPTLAHDREAMRLVSRAMLAVDSYVLLAARLAPGGDATRNTIIREEAASHITPDMLRLLAENPVPDHAFKTIRRAVAELGEQLMAGHDMMTDGRHLLSFRAALKAIAENDPTDTTPPTTRGHAAPGRMSRRLVRTGGDLEPRTYDSVSRAVEWLHANGRPKASKTVLYNAITKRRTAYGYHWEYETNPPENDAEHA